MFSVYDPRVGGDDFSASSPAVFSFILRPDNAERLKSTHPLETCRTHLIMIVRGLNVGSVIVIFFF